VVKILTFIAGTYLNVLLINSKE